MSASEPLNHVRHRECLARPGDTQQHLCLPLGVESSNQFPDRLRLIATWFVWFIELEGHGGGEGGKRKAEGGRRKGERGKGKGERGGLAGGVTGAEGFRGSR